MGELLATLLVLYGLQCVVLLPRGATLWLAGERPLYRADGPGWRMMHPWPSAWAWPAARPVLRKTADGLYTLGPTPWLGADFAEGSGVRLVPGSGQAVDVKGAVVKIDGQPAQRGLDPEHAERIGELFRSLAAAGADVDALLAADLGRSFETEELLARRERVAEATRWLGRLSDFCLVALLLVLPGLAVGLGGERALLFFGPVYAALHVAGVVLLSRTWAKLQPDKRGDRFEAVFAAALYPPLLLRSAQELRRRTLAGFHPAAVAAAFLPSEAALDFLRSELSRNVPHAERSHVERLIESLGTSPEALLAPPERSDPLAESYCTACRTEYRLSSGTCADCNAILASF